MSVEGRLDITLHKKDGWVEKVGISSSRPHQIASFFCGKTPVEALALMPSIFSICGIAQSSAALIACEQALTIETTEETNAGRQIAVWAETAREHITRIAIDWGKPVDASAIRQVMPVAQNIKNTLGQVFTLGGGEFVNRTEIESQISVLETYLEAHVFGESLEEWSQRQDEACLSEWALSSGTQAANFLKKVIEQGWQSVGKGEQVQPLPEFDGNELFEKLKMPSFIAHPLWNGRPCETTAFTRYADNVLIRDIQKRHGFGLLTRLTALLVELANTPRQMKRLLEGEMGQHESLNKQGSGMAQIEAARGRLVHGVQIKDGIISDYRILAPTEWNFHPLGVAAQSLSNLKAEDDETLLKQAKLVVCAIDPCVAFNLRIA